MIIPRAILSKFAETSGLVDAASKRVRDTLTEYCSRNGFVFDGRPKTAESLAEKIESGRFRDWNDLDDLYACTIGIPLPNDEETVLEYLQQTFEEIGLKRHLSANKPPDTFRFDSTRFHGRLRVPPGHERNGTIYSIRFEVQIKSLFELAWSRTTHALAYKSSRVDWRALRLAAALKASVEQMDLLLSDFESSMQRLGTAPWREIERKQAIQTFFLDRQAAIPREGWPKDLSRFIDNCFGLFEHLQRNERWSMRDKRLDIYEECFQLLDEFLSEHNSEKFPRSVSLFQLVFGVLTKRFSLPRDLDAWFPITTELESLFPHAKDIPHRFELT